MLWGAVKFEFHDRKETVLAVYSNIGWIAIGVGVAVLIVAPLIKKLMHLDTLKDVEVEAKH